MKRAFWIVMAVLIASIAVNVWLWMREPMVETNIETKTDTIWRDTVIEKPVPTESVQTGKVVYIKVAVPQPQTQRDTVHDSIDVALPVEQKRYDDSIYTAWVSGFEPNLDSIRLYTPEITTTITKTIVKPSPLFSVGIQTGAGYGIISRQPDFYIGIGGQLNLWRK